MTKPTESETLELLSSFTGERMASVRLIMYVYHGEIHGEDTWPEFVAENNRVLRLRDEDGGERLAGYSTLWEDPLANSSEANRKYVEEYGKYTRFDVSHSAPYEQIVGRRLRCFVPLYNAFTIFAGVELQFAEHWLTVYAAADETWVRWGLIPEKLDVMEWTRGTPVTG